VEGANGIGRPLAQRLLADGERVLDVPAKLAARARVSGTGQGRKTDAADAHAIVMVALRDKGLRELGIDPELTVLRMLCDRRDELSRARAQALNRLHRLFPGLLAGGAPVKKSARQYKVLLATVRPRDLAGKTCRRMAAEELEDVERLDVKLKAMKAELKAAVQATGSHLMDIHGIGPAGAATCSTWPASSSSATTLQAAPTTGANSSRPRPPWKLCAACGGCHDAVYRQLVTDAAARQAALQKTGPGGHSGASLSSSAAGLPPGTGTSDQPLPGPAYQTLPPPQAALKTPAAPIAAISRRRARGVNVERPTGRTTLTPTSAGAHSTAPGPRT
jgi:transposase